MRIPLCFFVTFAALSSLGANPFSEAESVGGELGKEALESSETGIAVSDLEAFVTTLASDQFEGRGTGDPGERMATEYFAAFLEGLGLKPEGDDSTFFQPFEFRAGMELKGENLLTVPGPEGERQLAPGEGYQPLSISASGEVEAEVVFVGYGIDYEDYDSFEGLDVEGKWMLVLRGVPEGRKEDLQRFAPLVQKARVAKEKGAAGILFIKAENPEVGQELIPPSITIGSLRDALPAITLSDELAAAMLEAGGADSDLKTLFNSFKSVLRVHQRFTEGKELTKAGFKGIEFEGMEVTPDDYCPANHIFLVNTTAGRGDNRDASVLATCKLKESIDLCNTRSKGRCSYLWIAKNYRENC